MPNYPGFILSTFKISELCQEKKLQQTPAFPSISFYPLETALAESIIWWDRTAISYLLWCALGLKIAPPGNKCKSCQFVIFSPCHEKSCGTEQPFVNILFVYHLVWWDTTLEALQTRPSCQILLFLWSGNLKTTSWDSPHFQKPLLPPSYTWSRYINSGQTGYNPEEISVW